MKKLIITIAFIFISNFCSAQIAVDSIKGYWNGNMIDSIYLQYTSHIPYVDTLVRGLDLSGRVSLNLAYIGCSTAVSVQKDTIFHLYNDSIFVSVNWGLIFGIWWDTSSICNFPNLPNKITSRFLFPSITFLDEVGNLESKINIFPNPVRDVFTINIEEDMLVSQLEIIDLQGRLVKSYQNHKKKFDVSSVEQGVYVLKITTPSGVAMKKVVVD